VRLERVAWPNEHPPNEHDLRTVLSTDGFEVMAWSDPPGRTYAPHSHDHDESLWCLRGWITFHAGGRDYRLAAGDRLMLPRDTVHAATVGPDGATYLIGEKR
jgi:quercetin dioxygenase-like cupin family protein